MYKNLERIQGKTTSVETGIAKVTRGYVVSGIDKTATFLPCDVAFPLLVNLMPASKALASATDKTGVALFTTVVGWSADVDSLKAASDLDAWSDGVDYEVGQIVKSNGAAYECIKAHTSDNTADTGDEPGVADNQAETYWAEISPASFVKVTHTSPGATDKVAQFAYEIIGY